MGLAAHPRKQEECLTRSTVLDLPHPTTQALPGEAVRCGMLTSQGLSPGRVARFGLNSGD